MRSHPSSLGNQETSAWVLLPAGAALRVDVSPAYSREELSSQ